MVFDKRNNMKDNSKNRTNDTCKHMCNNSHFDINLVLKKFLF